MKIEIETGEKLSKYDLRIINYWRKKEFKSEHNWNKRNRNLFYGHIIFLLKENEELLAFGRLKPITIYYNDKKYEIWGISTIVSIKRGKGYGKRIMEALKKYIDTYKKTSIGFCGKHNTEFYRKCGFKIIEGAQRNFIYIDEQNKENPGNDDDVIYLKGNNDLINILLSNNKAKFIHYVPHW